MRRAVSLKTFTLNKGVFILCGLVGCAGNISVNMEKVFRRLLELDTTRGPHSTGVLSVKGTGDCVVAKSLGTPWDLAENKNYSTCFTGVIKVLLGHNRWATKGKISKQNAHPFEFATLVGAHNGTLRSVANLDDYKDFDVDSENLYHDMNNNGVYDTIPKLNGAFALTWYDKVDNTINLIRNSERELYFTYTEDMRTLLWASEDWMLMVAAHQADVKIRKPQLLPAGVLHTFDVPRQWDATINNVHTRKLELFSYTKPTTTFPQDNKRVVELRPKITEEKSSVTLADVMKWVDKEIVFEVSSKEKNTYNQPYIKCFLKESATKKIEVRIYAPEAGELWEKLMGSSNLFRAFVKNYSMDVTSKYLIVDIRTILEIVPSDLVEDVPEPTYTVYEGEEVDLKEYERRTCKGCAWCASPVDETDSDEIVWFAKDDFLCASCAEQPEVKQYLSK